MRDGRVEMIKMNGEDEWEECPICMEPTNFDAITAQWWVCCGQRMCVKCEKGHNKYESTGVRPLCPFCRTPEIGANQPKHQSQLIMWAEKGKSWAQAILGDIYRDGEDVEKSMEKAIFYYNLAAEQAHSGSQGWLGHIYLNGEGVPVDYEKALHYYKLAAEGGHLPSYVNIGYMYGNGLGVPKSSEKAFQYNKKLADKGDEVAQYNVGKCYHKGIGVERDISLAIKYYSLSVDQNYKDAVIDLPLTLIQVTNSDKSYLFQAIYRTKCALKIITEPHELFALFKEFLERSKIFCGGCGEIEKKESWQILNLITKPQLNGKICEKVETLDNGRVKIKIDDLVLSVKPECLIHNTSDLLACGRCKVIMYCNITCQKKHWQEGGHKKECKQIV